MRQKLQPTASALAGLFAEPVDLVGNLPRPAWLGRRYSFGGK